MPGVIYLFSPKIGLTTQNIFRIHAFRNGLKFVGLIQAQGGINPWLTYNITLHKIEVSKCSRAHDYLVSHFSRSYATFDSPPAHDNRIWCQSAFQDLIPSNEFFALGLNNFF